MADQPNPRPKVSTAPPIDPGLAGWARLLEGSIAPQPGIEDLKVDGASISFRFRGQTFMVTVSRLS